MSIGNGKVQPSRDEENTEAKGGGSGDAEADQKPTVDQGGS
jgi:hypothetical protein